MNRSTLLAAACIAFGTFTLQPAQAQNGLAAHSAATAQGGRGAFAGQRGLLADGQGNVSGVAGGGFTTDSGAHGRRNGRLNRSADGSLTASGQASATGANGGSAQRSADFTRNADGSASGERSTTATNANTGVTLDGSATYSKGSGVNRSVTCKDAAGNTVSCGSR